MTAFFVAERTRLYIHAKTVTRCETIPDFASQSFHILRETSGEMGVILQFDCFCSPLIDSMWRVRYEAPISHFSFATLQGLSIPSSLQLR